LRRRESLSEIRAANPELALSGNIISATFNTPHSFVYRKGGDWVSFSSLTHPVSLIGHQERAR
jgi:trehalose 6-phosphate synthase/phosphatase